MLYTGGFEQRKNIAMLFRVISELKKEMEIELIFTGNFMENVQLKKMIKEHELEDEVKLTGIVSNEKLQDFYMQCDTVVNISLCEGFGRSNLEAMMYNKPLACSDIEVFKEFSR
ncbi:glycosyltransferase [Vibrio sp. PP-XX7]